MKENPDTSVKGRQPAWRTLAFAAAVLAVIQACFTIRGRGIEGFILWVIILFVGYWLLFTLIVWGWRRLRDRK